MPSPSPVMPSVPPVDNTPSVELDADALFCSAEGCECPSPSPGMGASPASMTSSVSRLRGAIDQSMPPPAATRGGQSEGNPYRVNPFNGRLLTSIAPPQAGAFVALPAFHYNSLALNNIRRLGRAVGSFSAAAAPLPLIADDGK